jgi:hypothetical protein
VRDDEQPIDKVDRGVVRSHRRLLETPWDVFDKGVLTPGDQFYVRWHWDAIDNNCLRRYVGAIADYLTRIQGAK